MDLDEEFDLDYAIKIKVTDRIYVEEESLYKVRNNQKKNKSMIFKTKALESKESGDIKVAYKNGKSGQNPDVQCIRSSSIIAQMATKMPSDENVFEENLKHINMIINNVKNILFLNPIPSEMRDYSRITDNDIKPNAENLSSVLFKLCSDEAVKKKILGIIGKLPENDIIDIDFIETKLGDVIFRLKEKYGNKSQDIDAKRVSDGTIRCIAIITALISESKDSIVIIEEVDNGIHPSRAKSLIDAISSISSERGMDVIITTHNTALLNAISHENLIGVSVAYRNDETGASEFLPFIDISKYPKLLAQGGLGDLAVTDEIVRAIKEKSRNCKDYSWLRVY